MIRFLKLVNLEINRFIKIYVFLLATIIVSQFIGIFFTFRKAVKNAQLDIHSQNLSISEYVNQFGSIDLTYFMGSLWFLTPLILSATVLGGYLFLIWYRDWFGKNTFIYRLLMLPTSRLTLYFAKATTLLVFVLGLLGFQLLSLPLELSFFQWIVPQQLRLELSTFDLLNAEPLKYLLPKSFMQFMLTYGAGMIVISVLFTAILFERSFRWKGLIMGILYCFFAGILFFFPLLITIFFPNKLYPVEFFLIEIALGLLIGLGSIQMSHYLLRKKITV